MEYVNKLFKLASLLSNKYASNKLIIEAVPDKVEYNSIVDKVRYYFVELKTSNNNYLDPQKLESGDYGNLGISLFELYINSRNKGEFFPVYRGKNTGYYLSESQINLLKNQLNGGESEIRTHGRG